MQKLLKNTDEMEVIINNHYNKTDRLVATIGMFDGVHVGHQFLISQLQNEATNRGLKSAVVTFRDHPQRVLRPESDLRMIMTLEERLKKICELGVGVVIVLDFTPEFSQIRSKEFIRLLRDDYSVDALVMGFNHRFGHNNEEYFEDYVGYGRELNVDIIKGIEYQGEYSPVSSSFIRKMLGEGWVDLASSYLTRPFELSGLVVPGKQNGRKIGFPTANLDVSPELIMPHRGVYAVRVELENGERRGGMANIGVRPTVERGGERTFEVNIFDFNEDIYGTILKVEFVKFMRSEVRFASFDELKERLFVDKEACIDVLSK